MRRLICLLLYAVALGGDLPAQVVVESFSYTVSSSLTGANGGTGFAGSWTLHSGAYSIASGSLAKNGLTTAGASVTGTGEFSRALSTSLGGASQSVWISALLNATNVTAGTDYAGVYFGSFGGAQFFGFGNDGAGNSVLGVATAAASGTGLDSGSTTTFTAGATFLLVLNLEFTSAGSGTYNFYVNPTVSTTPGTAVNASPIAFSVTGSDLVGLYSSGATSTVDELRIGTDFASVVPGLPVSAVPEPANGALLCAALAIGVIELRRRRVLI